MSGASQQKKKEGVKGKRQNASASSSGRQGAASGSAAAGHAAGARHGGASKGGHPSADDGSVRESGGGDGRATRPGGDGSSGFDQE